MLAARLFYLFLGYVATGWLGLQLPFAGTHITLLWLPTGIAIAALLLWGRAMWPSIFLAAFAVNLSIGSPWLLALGIAVGNTLGPVVAVLWLQRHTFSSGFNRQQDVRIFIAAATLGMAVSAGLGVLNLVVAGVLPTANAPVALLSWWMGDTVGVLLAAPLLLTLSRSNLAVLARDRVDLLRWVLVALPVMWLVFKQDFGAVSASLPLAFLTFPLLAWSALRFGKTGASLGGLLFSVAAAWGTATGHGTFHVPDQHISLFLLWAYMASTVAMGLLITALLAERKEAEMSAANLAFFDPLTQLPNRRLLMDRLAHALSVGDHSTQTGALLLLDLDHFKTLNDTQGHDVGDLLLQAVGKRLEACVRAGDTVARLGGDEFVVLLENLGGTAEEAASHAKVVCTQMLATLGQPYLLKNNTIRSTPSIGLTLFTGNGLTIDELFKQADLAMYQAKSAGRNTLRFFDVKMQALATARVALETDLREALRQEQFLLHYQPQVFGQGQVGGVEALVRWRHPVRGLVSPAEFIPMAEETGLILPLGLWVLERACAQLALWSTQPATAMLKVAVNVSALQMQQADFVEQVLGVLHKTGANAQHLSLELTENTLVVDVEHTVAKIQALKAHGVLFSVDDFGTGYSSLAYLKLLPLDELKIDQGFVRDILTDPNDAAIAKMVIALAASIGLRVVAEGVETEGQRQALADLGCAHFQGYLFSRPLPIADLEALLASSPRGISAIC